MINYPPGCNGPPEPWEPTHEECMQAAAWYELKEDEPLTDEMVARYLDLMSSGRIVTR